EHTDAARDRGKDDGGEHRREPLEEADATLHGAPIVVELGDHAALFEVLLDGPHAPRLRARPRAHRLGHVLDAVIGLLLGLEFFARRVGIGGHRRAVSVMAGDTDARAGVVRTSAYAIDPRKMVQKTAATA